jgi:uncharacterized protein YjbI with pentapeptide repeats
LLPNTTWGLYSKDFFENVLVEAHGMILDIAILGVVLLWFEKRGNLVQLVAKNKKAIAYLKFYRGVDASFRVYEAVRTLQEMKCKTIDLPNANLADLQIQELSLEKSNLQNCNFSRSILEKCDFVDCEADAAIFIDAKLKQTKFLRTKLRRAKFINAKLNGCDFTNAEITNGDFTKADLRSAIFKGVDCRGIRFEQADLTAANFKGALNLTQQQLTSAKTYRNAKF